MKLCNGLLAGCLLVGLIGQGAPAFAGGVGFDVGGVRLGAGVKSLAEIRNEQVVRQRWDYSCGSAALSTVLTYYLDDPTPESAVVVSILRRTDPVRVRSRGGFSLLDLKNYLGRRGYDSAGYGDLDVSDLETFEIPAIVPISLKGYDHFVVFRGRHGNRVLLADPAFGNMTMSLARFEELWNSRIAFVIRNAERRDAEAPLDIAMLPFPNSSAIQRLTSHGGFRRISLQ